MQSSYRSTLLALGSIVGGLSVSAIGCAGDGQSPKTEDDVEVSVSQPSSSASETSSGAATLDRRPPPVEFRLPTRDGSEIGEPCAKGDDANCGLNNRVSVERMMDNAYGGTGVEPPCGLVRIGQSQPGPYASSACVAGDHLIIFRQCTYCRMPSSFYVHARISMMSVEQHNQMQTMLEVAGPTPASARDWAQLIQKNQFKGDPSRSW